MHKLGEVLCCVIRLVIREKNEVKPIQNTTLDLSIVSVGDNFNLMTGTGGASFFTSADFGLTIKNLTDRFDKVFICSSYANAQLGLMAVAEFLPGLVVTSGLRKTRKLDIKNIKSRYAIDLLLHD